MTYTESDYEYYKSHYNVSEIRYRKEPEDIYEEIDLLYEKYTEQEDLIEKFNNLPISDIYDYQK